MLPAPRPAQSADATEIQSLIARVYAEYGCTLDLDGLDRHLVDPGRVFREQHGEFWVVESDGRIAATVAIRFHDDDSAELKSLYVHPDFRRRGWGRALTGFVMAQAVRQGKRRMILWSDARFLSAHRLYQRLGFRSDGWRVLGDVNRTCEIGFSRALPARAADLDGPTTAAQAQTGGLPATEPRIIDISPAVSPALAVWPGDTAPRREVLLDMQRGDNLTLSTLHATVHLGAHADAPSHYSADGPGIELRDLSYYVGRCQVLRVAASRGQRITPDQLTSAIEAPRLLLATGTFPDPTQWNADFAALDPELVDWIAARGVRTIGIDTPSVDLFDSKDLPAHRRILAQDMAILEGLVLGDVPDGVYELIALPLKLTGFDASPVRAALRGPAA